MNAYLITSTIVFLILGITWKNSDFINWLAKIILIGLGIIGLILVLQYNGYIIKQ